MGAVAWYLDASERKDQFEETDEFLSASEAERNNWDMFRYGIYRERFFAKKLAKSVAYMSGYHSFRTAVKSRQQFGEYEFLDMKYEESLQGILTAPFNFSYFKRPTTWGYLAFETAWLIAQYVLAKESGDFETDAYTFEDAAYTGGFSYLAGTAEESMFRGFLMPALREYTGSYFIANIVQTTLFTLGHAPDISITHPLFGYYTGWLKKRNNRQIGESVFIHFWTDVMSLAITYMIREKDNDAAVMMLPLISFSF